MHHADNDDLRTRHAAPHGQPKSRNDSAVGTAVKPWVQERRALDSTERLFDGQQAAISDPWIVVIQVPRNLPDVVLRCGSQPQ